MMAKNKLYPHDWSWQAQLTVNDSIIDAFAALTRDVNTLHTDSAEAGRSPYRQRVSHGMLPVSLLLLSDPLANGTVIKKISGRFTRPVLSGDTVTVELRPLAAGSTEQTQAFAFTVRTSSINENATYGEITIGIHDAPATKAGEKKSAKEPSSLVTAPLKENTLRLADMTKGLSERIPFSLAPEPIAKWLACVKKHGKFSSLPKGKYTPSAELCSALLSSTLVGMRLPGKLATFLDLSLNYTTPLKNNAPYTLEGTVDFISRPNQIIIETIAIYDKKTTHPYMQGKLTVKINETSAPFPTVKELKAASGLGLEGKTVLITGASRGIGATTARLFACYGANVVVNYCNSRKEADAVVEDITSSGGNAIAVKADVSKRSEVQAMFKQACKKFGSINILVNNAVGDFLPVAFQSLTWERLQKDLDVVVQGAFNCCQEAIPSMMERKHGRIINVGTIATETPPANQSKYVVAKSALIGLTRSLAVELAAHNILVNMVVPGMVETDLTQGIPPAVREKIKNNIPLGRHASTTDVAKAIVTLASSLTPYTTGQKLLVTGGLPPFI